jgi:23S rRNA (cytidine1920-2'-O)/16S rRNA (cytidine1409-2'-O)-methyltransferase
MSSKSQIPSTALSVAHTRNLKPRLDQLLLDRGLAASRAKAQAMIQAGEVYVGEQKFDKAGTRVAEDVEIVIKQRRGPFASRAGAKLLHALDYFSLDVTDCVALDTGASTGGFVGVLLERGAKRVYAVDVGYGQLDYKLQTDPRVIVRDRVNVRYLEAEQVPEPIDFMSLDLSFISITKVLEPLLPFLAPSVDIVCLVKPQFEVGREHVGKGGIVRDESARLRAVEEVKTFAESLGLGALGFTTSPITGQKGNVEYLLALRRRVAG